MNKLAETEARVERRYQRYRSDADHEALKWFRQESQLMENSPIYELKVKMQEKMKTGEIAQKLQSLEQLKQMIIYCDGLALVGRFEPFPFSAVALTSSTPSSSSSSSPLFDCNLCSSSSVAKPSSVISLT
jgi:hypothetical protein